MNQIVYLLHTFLLIDLFRDFKIRLDMMQLVLLSGGSGMRLWPLSNNVRSKQFLPLLELKNGKKESMAQRVLRQVTEANLIADITVATNKNQLDIVKNQLGESVSIVTEPYRRDTFPAIALVSSYLRYVKGCSDDDVVVVMPCDLFTDLGYFETIRRMVECVKENVSDLVLMGVVPTYPSEKYGYILPETDECEGLNGCKRVSKFKEKPDVKTAEQLLKLNAFWNAGVFAFRLGYMKKFVHKYVPCESFVDVRDRYLEFPKTSFDYEIVEKAKSVVVVPFTGEWKDLGTWDTLTNELSNKVIGNAIMGKHCKNTHVINELQTPIYVDGVKDVVVAACLDGILICDKKHSENIKQHVQNLISRPMYEERRWGIYRVLDNTHYDDGRHSITKFITLNAGKNISYQVHHHRSETWTFVQGEGIFVLDGHEQNVKAGDTVIVPVEHWHAIKAISELSFIEVQNGDWLSEDDIDRKTWDFKNS